MAVKTFKISARVWASFSAEEQRVMRHIVPSHGLTESKAFIRGLRAFGGQWSHGFCAVRDGRLFAWSESSRTWHDIGEPRQPAPSNGNR